MPEAEIGRLMVSDQPWQKKKKKKTQSILIEKIWAWW
jgi:hypothetical protein